VHRGASAHSSRHPDLLLTPFSAATEFGMVSTGIAVKNQWSVATVSSSAATLGPLGLERRRKNEEEAE
jgi:hypothetical protein